MLPIEPDKPKPPTLESRTLVYSQDEDSCGRANTDTQFLEIDTPDAGDGPYIVIKTERWAIEPDEIPAFMAMLENALDGLQPQPDAGGKD